MRVAFSTLGCRLNQAETDAMEAAVERAGHALVSGADEAEVFVLNSCTITHQADADVRAAVRRARRRNPDVRVVVTGCRANADPEAVARLPEVDLVLGNGDKHVLPERLQGLPRDEADASGPHAGIEVSPLTRRRDLVPLRAAVPRGRARALLKVQDGCNYRCAFCIVPRVRGPSRSLPVARIVDQARRLADGGAAEIVLTGIHLGTFGRDLRPRARLSDLVAALLPAVPGVRLRLSSIDPHEVDAALIALMQAHPERICRHLHLPVQSGDPAVLRRMRRGHTAQDFRRLVGEVVDAVPGIAIGTDVIVGFPGEDDAAFERTLALLEALPLSYHHVFTYSKRADTAAAQMDGQVEPAVKAARNRALRELSARQHAAFAAGFVGQRLDGVVEHGRRGEPRVLTDNYLRLPLRGSSPRSGTRGRFIVRAQASGLVAV